MKQSQQTTLRAAITLSGVGVHSGDEVKIVLHPAEAIMASFSFEPGFPAASTG